MKRKMLELSNKDFKALMSNASIGCYENKWKIENFSKEIDGLSKEI